VAIEIDLSRRLALVTGGFRGDRFDTTDRALDVVVGPDGRWRWKDEDDFARAIELGGSRTPPRPRRCVPRASV
jgi:hypothetical protein